MTTVGVVGLGEMGRRIAARLLATGHGVRIWNRSQEKGGPLVEMGALRAKTPAEVARDCSLVITLVADPAALRAVTEGPEGIAAGASQAVTVCEMSTVGPEAVCRLAQVLPTGTSLIDAPVIGSLAEAESGRLTVLVGGDNAVVQKHLPVLEQLGSVIPVGGLGAGAAAKLMANSVYFGSLGVLGEALAFADALGITRDAAFQVLSATPLRVQAERRRVVLESGDFRPRFRLALAAKDARLIRAAASGAALNLPLVTAAASWLNEAEDRGLGDQDYTAMLMAILEVNASASERHAALTAGVRQADRSPGLLPWRYDGLIIDLDGVVWRGYEPIPGAAEAIGMMRSRGVRHMFLTNEPRLSRSQVADRLSALGIPAAESDVVTSGSGAGKILASLESLAGTHAFVIGPPALRDEITAAGFHLLPPEQAARATVVVVAAHEEFDYHELRAATSALRQGARLFGTGRDPIYPSPSGSWPGTGAILAAVEVAGGTTATIIGKPEPAVFDVARSALADCERVAVVGDTLESDIAGAKRAGLDAILVLTGNSQRDDIRRAIFQPDLVIDSLSQLAATISDA